jgi:SpoIID/LytB domain protein
VAKAVEETRGEVLLSEGDICDARFSKCCGGRTEEFQYCWEDQPKPYLVSVEDPFCHTKDVKTISQVLNDYDQETTDFYRWKVKYTQEQLSALIAKRTGDDYGRIRDLQPVARGTSGRLYKMKIVGEKLTKTIGKELAIRYALSESALYSSAFIVERHDIDGDGYPARFVLRGAGWGHGVGLCQIGAAVMGAKGYKYDQILLHYFVDANITKQY